ncbi:MAG TPA: AAA family ATPase [Ktedonobacterales bacterium]|nr:AAA family ATPase [Ktedonobacterales bacterium]
MRPTIILLIGTSSAGKSSLAKRLQEILPEPYLLLGIDDVFRMVPERWGGGLGGPLSAVGFRYDRTSEPGVITIRYGAEGERILRGMHRAVAAFAEAGNNIIVDEMLLDERILVDWAEQLGRFHPYLVQVTAAVEVLEQRERRRGNEPGLSKGHLLHNALRYRDLLIDTTDCTPTACADTLLRWMAMRPPATALDQYRHE